MKLFQNCRSCGYTVTDRKLLQLLEVYPVHCPNCGAQMKPFHAEESEEIAELVDDEEMTMFGKPVDFKPNIKVDLGKD